MLYQLTAVVDSPDGPTTVERVVEAPAHRSGNLPGPLRKWFTETFLTQFTAEVVAYEVAVFQPLALGYRGANEWGVSYGGSTTVLRQFDPDHLLG